MKEAFKVILGVFVLYVFAMLIGAALTQQSKECLVISIFWAGIILIIFPIFRKRGNE